MKEEGTWDESPVVGVSDRELAMPLLEGQYWSQFVWPSAQ